MKKISVVVPVYKAESYLNQLYERLKRTLESLLVDFEIILVEDCGGDRSWEIIKELAAKDVRVKGFQFTRNFGQHYGITAGLDHCDGDWVVIMDCDLQDRPEEIPKLYAKVKEGYHVVLARRGPRKDPFLKRVASDLFYRFFRYLSGMDYDGSVGNFRIISKNVVMNFRQIREQLRFFGGLMNWMGYPCVYVEVAHEKSALGRSTYTFRKLFKLAVETIIAYSDKPLKLSIKIGFFMSSTAFVCGVYIVWLALFMGIPVMGWPSLMVSFYFLGGLIIAILGVMGVYLGKTFDESKRRPLYVILNQT